MINAPVLHVNGDYPEGEFFLLYVGHTLLRGDGSDVQRAMDVAFKYRNYFRKDIIVDLIVYRRWLVQRPMTFTLG